MCIENVKRINKPTMIAWKVFKVIDGKYYSPVFIRFSKEIGGFEEGVIYDCKADSSWMKDLENEPEHGFHAFIRKLKAKSYKRRRVRWAIEDEYGNLEKFVVKRVLLYDALWKGKYNGFFFRDVITAKRMEILPD